MKTTVIRLLKTSVCLLAAWAACSLGSGHAWAQYTPFANVTRPLGVATTSDGTVYVHGDNTWDHGMFAFSATGQPLGYMTMGGLADTSGMSYYCAVPVPNLVLACLRQDGGLKLFTQFGPIDLGNVRFRPTDTSWIYDVAQGRSHNFSGLINMSLASFGDVAAYRPAGQNFFYILASGITVGKPFVLRVKVSTAGQILQSKVIVSSTATTAGTVNIARGLAANSRGIAVTTLPCQTPAGGVDRVVSFNVENPIARVLNSTVISTFGVGTDRYDYFFLVATMTGTVAPGSLVAIAPDGASVAANLPSNVPLADARDVAVSPDGRFVYVTQLGANTVYRRQIRN